MNRILFCCLLVGFGCLESHAQRHELGFLVGGVNYIGEVGSTQFFNPKHLGYGIIYKRNLNQRIALRAQLSSGKFSANDRNATDFARRDRNYSFTNSYYALGIGVEVNYVPLPIGDFGTSWTPYLHVGIQPFLSNDWYHDTISNNLGKKKGSKMTVAIPFGAGVKFNLGQYWVIAAEVQPQFTFSDNLDGSEIALGPIPPFSTSLSTDWLVFTGISITYAFGRLPCCRE